MKRLFCVTICLFFLAAAVSCSTRAVKPEALAPVQRGAMQSKELKGDVETVFAATLSVLQDQGWHVEQANKDTGLIQATSVKRQDILGPEDDWRAAADKRIDKMRRQAEKMSRKKIALPKWTRWEEMTVHLEPWGADSVRERITLVRAGSLPSGRYLYPYPDSFGKKKKKMVEPAREESTVVDAPEAYQRLFQEIQKAVFVRQGLKGL